MSEQVTELKITGWEYNGFKLPNVNVKIDDVDNKRNFTLFQMLSGEGKTTTLNLLRNAFFDINSHSNPNEIKKYIEEVRSEKTNITEGSFTVHFKLNNNTNYKIKVIFDYQANKIRYNTFKGDGSGFEEGLKLPDNISRFITAPFLEITFFDLELTDDLYKADEQQTDKIIKKLCKLDYLDEMGKSLDRFLTDLRKRNQGKLNDKDLEKNEKLFEKLRKHRDAVLNKEKKFRNERSRLKKNIDAINIKIEKIKEANADIKDKINQAKEFLDEKNENFRNSLNSAFDLLKNPMSINPELEKELKFFEKNLTKKRIPKGVGEAFFDEIIESKECLCGNHMTEEMKKKIESNKILYLAEENIAILNPIKTSIRDFNNLENVEQTFNNLVTSQREVNIANSKYDKVYENTDDKDLEALINEKKDLDKELEKINSWIDDVFSKPYRPDEPPNTESIKTLNKKITELEEDIQRRSKTIKESKKIKRIKQWLEEIQEISLKKISDEIIKDINKEVKRVLPLEEIYVESIKNKITLISKDGNRRSGASRGQMARIAYLFLINLLNRSNLKFPLIVDSPVTALDAIGRKEIAKGLVKDYAGQYIGFIFDIEKGQFAEVLRKELKENINLITVFNKSEASKHMLELASNHNVNVDEFESGVVSYDKDFFDKFTGVKN